MFEVPDVRLSPRATEGLIADETFGDGPVDLVHTQVAAQTVEGIWDLVQVGPAVLTTSGVVRTRGVLIDRHGTGLSDPLRNVYSGGDFGPWLEEAVSDVITVLDAIGWKRVAVLANRYGTTVAISLAATHPDRVTFARPRRPSGAAPRN